MLAVSHKPNKQLSFCWIELWIFIGKTWKNWM